MTPAEFCRDIKTPDRRPLYLLTGGEPAAVGRCLAAAQEAVDPGLADFNYQTLELEAGQAKRLLGEAATRPFLAPPRLMVVKNPPFNGDDWGAILDYLGDPNRETTIIITVDKFDARLKLAKKIKADNAEVDCTPPRGAGLVKWLAAEFTARGVTASPQVCSLIIERAGTELNVLLGEAEKLSLYVGQGGALTPAEARRLVSLAPNANVFELGEALGRHDLPSALSTLLDLAETEPPLMVLAMMVRHFRLIFQIKARQAELGVKRLPREEAAHLKLHPFVLEKTQGQAAAWPWREVTRALAALEEAHRTLVTSSTPAEMVLENLALTLGRANKPV